MKLRRMQFEGIRSFTALTDFNFGKTPGLYFLQGAENEVDPELGSNGVGKSTIWGILCWIMFGKMPDGLRAGDLKSWQGDKKGYRGKVWIGRDLLARSWHPNKLTWNGEVIEQPDLNDKLGLTYDTFLTSVLLSQGEEMFFDFSPAKKLSIFTSLLDLNVWTERSAAAKEKADDIGFRIEKQINKISRLEGKIDGLGIAELRDKKKTFKESRSILLQSCRASLREFRKNVKLLQTQLNNAEAHESNLSVQKKTIREECQVLRRKLEKKKAKLVKVDTEVSVLTAKAEAFLERAQHLKKHKDKKCSACGQHISAATAKSQIKKLKALGQGIIDEAQPLSNTADKLDRVVSQLTNSIQANENDLDSTNRELKKIRQRIKEITENLSISKAAKKSAHDRLTDCRSATNPYSELIDEKEAQEETYMQQLKIKNTKLVKMERKKAHTMYWVQGFKDLRLYLIEEALGQLEIETNKALSELGFSSEWAIKYSVVKQAKTGSLVSGFNVHIKCPQSKKQVPFAVWSGGEKQRLKIAGSMGLISLISARTGTNLGLEVYDEPTQHLSPEGIDSLLEALRLRALETSTRIWLVDHHTLDYGEFIGTAIVSKKTTGSEVWQS